MGIMTIHAFHVHGKDQRILRRIMLQVVRCHIVQIGFGKLHRDVGGCHISVVTGKAVALFFKGI
jgi:hypothetical protein